MKKVLFLAGVILLCAACSNENENMVNNPLTEETMVPVNVRVDGFEVEQADFSETRGTAVGNYTYLKALTLAFYKSDGTEVYKHTQFKNVPSTFTTFGEFSTTLGLGSYTMVVLGYGSESEISLTSPTVASYTSDAIRETFAATQDVIVSNGNAKNLTATLDRVISLIAVVSTDNRSADVTQIRTTFSGGSKNFNPTTGLAIANDGVVNTVSTSADGITQIANYLFLTSDQQEVDVTIETLDAEDHVLFSKTLEDVPLKRNRVTTLTGAMYSVTSSTSTSDFQVNNGWLTGNNVNF